MWILDSNLHSYKFKGQEKPLEAIAEQVESMSQVIVILQENQFAITTDNRP